VSLVVNAPPAVIGQCSEFKDLDGIYQNRTIVITPLRLSLITEDLQKISFGCNYWKSCQNKSCSYCQAGMERIDYEKNY
jgi:hypothetical protein